MNKKPQIDTQVYQQIMRKIKSQDDNPPVRLNVGTENDKAGKKIYCRKIPVNQDGYDTGGGYWGSRRTVYVHYTLDKSYVLFSDKKKDVKRKQPEKYNLSNEAFAKVLANVDCSKGIPNGRQNVGLLEQIGDRKVYSREIKLNPVTYTDRGGAYWGPGDPVFVDFTLDLSYIYFHREHYGSLFDIDKL